MTAATSCRCPRARHRHGTKRCYLYCGGGCRCAPCSAANAEASRQYRRTCAQRRWNGGSAWVDATGPLRRLQALSAAGWSAAELAHHLGTTDSAVFWLRRNLSTRCTATTAATIARLYDQLAHITPAGHAVERTRRWAERAGWIEPWRWDDVDIDDPHATPTALPADELDEIAVERLMAGTLHVARGATSPERVEAVRRLAARGYSDPEIADIVGGTRSGIGKVRERHGIPAGRTATAGAA